MNDLFLRQRGWQKRGREYVGYYRTWYKTLEGKIRVRTLQCGDFFIKDPPPELKNHRHWACFGERGDGWYEVHFDDKPKSIEEGIRCIEKLLIETFRLTYRGKV